MFEEMINEMLNNYEKGQNARMRVIVEEEGEATKTYDENFLLLHVGEKTGTVLGIMDSEGMLQCVDMVLDSTMEMIMNMPPLNRMAMALAIISIIKNNLPEELAEGDE